MRKRFWALLLALCMLAGGAAAQEISGAPIATYILPQGAEAVHLWDSGTWEIPEGLDGMYRLMQTATVNGDVYLVRMPNGRALVSVSCMPDGHQRTAQELKEMWPQIAQNIAKEGVTVNADESCATVEQLYGFETLHIQTTLGLGELGADMQLSAEAFSFTRGSEFLEVWAVAPIEGTYAADNPAAQELRDDRADLEAFVQSLQFSDLESMAVEGVLYADPDGRFELAIPAGCTVLTVHSTQEEIAQARQQYIHAHEEGADGLFDEYMNDVITQRVTVVITEDQQAVLEIFAAQEESFRDVTADQLAMLARPIEQSFGEKFDFVMCMADNERTIISGREHAWLGYWVRSGEADVQVDVLAAVLEDAWLYEVDLFTHDGDQQLRTLLMMLVNQTMQYTPLTNALGE